MRMDERVRVRLPAGLATKVRELAEAEGCELSTVVRRALYAELERQGSGSDVDANGSSPPPARERQFERELRRVAERELPRLDEALVGQVRYRVNLLLQRDHPAAVFWRSVFALPPSERERLRQSVRFRGQVLSSRAPASTIVREWIAAAARAEPPAPPCPECGVAGGLHAADCELAGVGTVDG